MKLTALVKLLDWDLRIDRSGVTGLMGRDKLKFKLFRKTPPV